MIKKIILSISIVCILIISIVITSCSDSADGKSTQVTTNNEISGDTTSNLELIEMPDIPDTANFDGHEFVILLTGNWEFNDFEATELNGDLINDEIFMRNSTVEEKYNVKITPLNQVVEGTTKGNGPGFTKINQSVAAGDYAYDAALIGAYDVSTLAYNGLLSDLNSFPYIDLTKSWWDQKANEDLSIKGIMYYTTGDISMLDNDCTYCVLFNKEMIEDFSMDSPYDLVRNNKWTIDKFIEMGKQVSADINGDGKHDQNDLYGLLIWQDSMLGMISAAGEKVATVTDDGIELTLNTDRVFIMLEKYMSLAYDKTLTFSMYHLGDHATNMFSNNQILLYTRYLKAASWFRDMETDFGILPYPKFDENQDRFYTNIHAYGTSFLCVPAVVENMERTGIILESLAYESKKTITPAYYEKTMTGKYFRDEESADMLDILLSTRVFDVGLYYQVGGYNERLMDLLRNYNTDFTSMFAKYEMIALDDIAKINAAYDEAIAILNK